MSRCAGIRADGGRCKAEAMPEAEWCWNHHPDYEQARRQRASKGGKRGGRGRPMAVTGELVRLQGEFEEIADKVLAGEVERGDGAVVAQLLNGARACVRGLLKAREQEELYERVEELARRLSVNQRNHNQKGRKAW